MHLSRSLLLPCLIAPVLMAEMPPLVKAAYDGDMTAVRTLVAGKADLEQKDEYGWTALMFAVYQRDEPMVDLLLKAGANPSPRSEVGWHTGKLPAGTSPLGITAFYGFTNLAERLLQAHADTEQRDVKGRTPIMIAIEFERYGVVELLDPSQTRGFAKTLEEAALTDDFQGAARLIAEKAPLEQLGQWTLTPLMRAIYEGNDRVALLLLASGANPNAQVLGQAKMNLGPGTTPLILAAKYDRRAVVEPLLRAKADPALADASGRTALAYAKKNEYKEIAAMLAAKP